MSSRDRVPNSQVPVTALRQITWLGMILNLVLVAIKATAGFFAHSQVLIADAVHSLSDLSTDVAILVGSRFWTRPADADHPYGHAKLETVVTVFIGLVLIVVAYELIINALHGIYLLIEGEERRLPGLPALIAAVISIVSKEWLFRRTIEIGRRYRSTAILANAYHHRSDAISSIPAALAVGICLIFGAKYSFLDPVGTILVSCLIFYSAVKIIHPALGTLMDRGMSAEEVETLKVCVRKNNPQIIGLHKLRTRPLGGESMSVDLHIEVDPLMPVRDAHYLSHKIANDIKARFPNVLDVFCHIEPVSEQEPDRNKNSAEEG